MTSKDTNPKDAIGSNKLPIHLWPETATALGSVALLNGALKYGRANWRVAGVRASIYYDALRRHTAAWFEGEETDPDDGVDHLAAALACLAILVDARAAGKLTDDRQVKGGYREHIDKLAGEVTRLKALHTDKTPFKHYDIQHELLGKSPTHVIVDEVGKLPSVVATADALNGWRTVTPGRNIGHPECPGLIATKLRSGHENTGRQVRPYQNWTWGEMDWARDNEIVAWKYAE